MNCDFAKENVNLKQWNDKQHQCVCEGVMAVNNGSTRETKKNTRYLVQTDK